MTRLLLFDKSCRRRGEATQTTGESLVAAAPGVVDQLNRQLHRELASFMIEQPANIPRCLHLMGVARAFEREADHAANIAGEVVYLYEGKDIRHTRA